MIAPGRWRALFFQLALSIPELGIAWAAGLAIFWGVTSVSCRVLSHVCVDVGGIAIVVFALATAVVAACAYWLAALVLGLAGRTRTRYVVDALVAVVALSYIGALEWQASRSEAAARAASAVAMRQAAEAREKWIAALRQNADAHGPPGVVPPMITVVDRGRDVEVTNTTAEWLVVALARVRAANPPDGWDACPLVTVGEISTYYRFGIGPAYTTRYAPLPECAAAFDGALLEYRVGDPPGLGWWSDSAFAAPDGRLR
jgi:hypothetical protein